MVKLDTSCTDEARRNADLTHAVDPRRPTRRSMTYENANRTNDSSTRPSRGLGHVACTMSLEKGIRPSSAGTWHVFGLAGLADDSETLPTEKRQYAYLAREMCNAIRCEMTARQRRQLAEYTCCRQSLQPLSVTIKRIFATFNTHITARKSTTDLLLTEASPLVDASRSSSGPRRRNADEHFGLTIGCS